MNQRKRARCERALQRMERYVSEPPVKQKNESKADFDRRKAEYAARVERHAPVIERTRRNLGHVQLETGWTLPER